MIDCCSSSKTKSKRHSTLPCPANAVEYKEVEYKTVAQHIMRPWELDNQERSYFFCEAPNCDIVYFSDDNLIFRQSDIRTKVGLKDKSEDAIVCYCFGVTKRNAQNDPNIKTFVKAQTKQKLCSCKTRNPSGLCCLKNFPR